MFNVAADGWLSHDDAGHLLPRAYLLPPLPAELLAARARTGMGRAGSGEIPPGVVPYLVHPWVIANDSLKALGWEPTHSNEKAIHDGIASLPEPPVARRD